MTYLGHSNDEAVSHIWDEAINVHTQITANKQQENMKSGKSHLQIKHSLSSSTLGGYNFSSLHFDKVPILQYDIRVTLQRGVMTYAVVNWHTSRKSDTCERKRVNEGGGGGGAESETSMVSNEKTNATMTYLSSCLFPSWRFSQFLPWWRHLPFHTGWARRLQP